MSVTRSLPVLAALLVACAATDAERSADPAPTTGVPDETVPEGPATDSEAPSETPAASDPSPEIRAFDDALATAICARLASCCSANHYATYFARYQAKPYEVTTAPPAAQCASSLAQTLWILHGKWAQSAARQRVSFDRARAKACIAAIDGAACGVPLAKALNDDACTGTRGNEVFVKRTPLGAACQDISDGTFYGECDPKLGFCGSDGTCQAWSKTGEPCQVIPTRKFCAPDLACDGGSAKTAGACSPPPITKKLGESCGALTGAIELCESGSYCDYVSEKCEPLKADGASCFADDECKSAHPYTCSPVGSGKCGSTSFCSGGPQ